MDVFDLLAKISLDTSEFDKGLDAIKNGASRIAGIGAKAIGAATAAITGFGVASVKTGMGFDSAMAQVAATMGKTTDQMLSETASVELSWGTFTGNLREYAQEMGANTVFSATQAAEALNYMALAGYDTQKSMETLPSVMNLASAGAMDLASASDMVTDTETALGLEAERTTKLIDEMAKTASSTNTSVSQLGSAILTIGGTAKQLNGGMVELADGTKLAYDGTTELSVALGILADNGTKGSAAGTTLRNVLSSISGGKFEKSFGALGVSAYDAEGKMRPLKDILADMNTVMDGMTDQEKTNLINSTFNARDLKNINALLATTDEKWAKLVKGLDEAGEAGVMYAGQLYTIEEAQKKFGDAIYDSEQGFKVLGAAEMMAFQQMDNLSGDITLFRSALEGAQIAISDKVTPSLRDFVKEGSAGLSEFTNKLKSGDMKGAINEIGKTIGEMAATAASKVPDMIEAGATLLSGLGEGIANNFDAISESGIQVVSYLFESILGAIPGQMENLTQIVIQIGDYFAESFPVLAEKGGELIQVLFQGIMTAIPRLVEAGAQFVNSIAGGITQAVPNLLSKALPMLLSFSETLRSGAGTLVDAGINLLLNLAQGIMDSVPMLLEQLPDIIINIAGVINDNAPKLLVAGVELIVTIGKGIVQAIPALIENFPKIFQAILAVWSALNWMDLGRKAITALGNGVKSMASNIPNALKTIGQRAKQFFQGIPWAEGGRAVINSIVNAIRGMFTAIPSALTSIGSAAVSAFKSINWWDVGANVIKGIVSGLSANVSWIVDAAKNAAKKALDTAKSILGIKSPSKVFRDEVGKMIPRGMALGISDAEKYVDVSMDRLGNRLLKDFDGLSLPTVKPLETIAVSGAETGENGKIVYITNNITVDGAEAPEDYANRLVREMELQVRTA